jgi:ABC-type Fe3+ transport system substrate-binding protein
VADHVGQGQMWIGLTDNDDVDAARRGGRKLEMVLPDQGEGEQGTLRSLHRRADCPREASRPAKQLIDYLLSAEVERKLIDAKFARYSVRAGLGVETDSR